MRLWKTWDPREQHLGSIVEKTPMASIFELPDVFADVPPPRFHDAHTWLSSIWAEIATHPKVPVLLPTRFVSRFQDFAIAWSQRLGEPPPSNLLVGLLASTQAEVDEQIVALLKAPAERRALIIEPRESIWVQGTQQTSETGRRARMYLRGNTGDRRTDWMVVRGREEPVHPAWVRFLLDQAARDQIPSYFGGWGRWLPVRSCEFGTPEDHMMTMTSRGEKKHPATLADVTAVGAPQGFIKLERLDTTCQVDMIRRRSMPEGL